MPVSALMWGEHYMTRYTMVHTLFSSIGHVFWHDLWTNGTHDDRDLLICSMLTWQALHDPYSHDAPFTGENLFALIIMGKLSHLLRSLPLLNPPNEGGDAWLEAFEPSQLTHHPSPAGFPQLPAHEFLDKVRLFMGDVSNYLITQLDADDREPFNEFWKKARSYYETEFHKRVEYNRANI
jgi:hypothetical protein